jgi:acyl-CoA thioester hydrolase
MRRNEIHVFPLTIDFDLLDAGNVVHHPNYLILCERARSKAMDDIGVPHSDLINRGMSFALTETKSKYLKPALLGQKLSILTRPLESSRATLTLEQQLVLVQPQYQNLSGYLQKLPDEFIHQTYFWIELRLVCVKLNPLKAQPIPEMLVEKLNLRES